MNVEEMGAGRELDLLIDVRVMGAASRDVSKVGYGPTPRYSTDISAAWEVLCKLKEKFRDVTVTSNPFVEGEGWECSVEHPMSGEIFAVSAALDAPLAICRAALKAVKDGGK
jgi:hypothetical protein